MANDGNAEKRLLDEAMGQFRAGNHEEARRLFEEFLRRYPRTDLSDNAHYNLAKIHLATGDKQRALDEFNILVNDFPGSDATYFAKDERIELMREMGIGPEETPDERYQAGKDAYAKGDLREALEIFKVFLDRYADSDLADNVHYNMAKIYQKLGEHDLVKQHVQIILERYPESDAAMYAQELLDE